MYVKSAYYDHWRSTSRGIDVTANEKKEVEEKKYQRWVKIISHIKSYNLRTQWPCRREVRENWICVCGTEMEIQRQKPRLWDKDEPKENNLIWKLCRSYNFGSYFYGIIVFLKWSTIRTMFFSSFFLSNNVPTKWRLIVIICVKTFPFYNSLFW